MTELSPDTAERSRKNEQAILRALASTGQAGLAKSLGVAESTISRMKSPKDNGAESDLATTSKMLALLGLKVVPTTMKCYPQEQVAALFVLAKSKLDEMHTVEDMKLSF